MQLHILTEKEMELIQELFFLEKSEREAAGLFHVSQNTIHYRKNRVLEKLKKELSPLALPYVRRASQARAQRLLADRTGKSHCPYPAI